MAVPNEPVPSQTSGSEHQGCLGALLRLSWLAFGSGALFILMLVIAKSGRISALDVLFWLVVAGMAVARYIDITRFGGQTSSCEPATLHHWRLYIVRLIIASAVMWGLAHSLLKGVLV